MSAIVGLLALTCCSSPSVLDREQAQRILQAPVLNIEEQVLLTYPQLRCAIDQGLWEPAYPGVSVLTAKLSSIGKALGFQEDIMIEDASHSTLLVPIRGKFAIYASEILSINDSGNPGSKVVELRGAAAIPHTCFADPLPLAPRVLGKPTAEGSLRIEFTLINGAWRPERILAERLVH